MDKPLVIAFLGRAGSGKSTAAEYIAKRYEAKRISFAGPLKKLAKHLLDFTDEQVYGTAEQKETIDPRYGFTPRQFMQRLGEGARGIFGKDIWIDLMKNRIIRGRGIYVIDDMRYANEARAIGAGKATGNWTSCIVKLECPDAETNVDASHPSEAEVDQVPRHLITRTIVSCRSPDSIDLKKKLDEFFRAFVV